MRNKRGGGVQPGPTGRSETCLTVVSDLASVVEQVRKSLKLIESEIASEATLDEAAADDIVVLDDVTPGYARAYAVLRECDAGLSVALHLLQQSVRSGDRTCEVVAEGGLPQARSPISA